MTVSRVSNGNFTLTAMYNFNCISNVQTKSIDIGPYGNGDYPISGPSTACKNQTLNFTAKLYKHSRNEVNTLRDVKVSDGRFDIIYH